MEERRAIGSKGMVFLHRSPALLVNKTCFSDGEVLCNNVPSFAGQMQIHEICRTLRTRGLQNTFLCFLSKLRSLLSSYAGCLTCYQFQHHATNYSCCPCSNRELHLHSILNRKTVPVFLTFLTLSLQIFKTYIFSFYESVRTVPS